MRIALVTSELAVGNSIDGGLGNAVLRLAYSLVNRNQEVVIIRCGNEEGPKILQGVEIRTVPIPTLRWHHFINRLSRSQFDMTLSSLLVARRLGEALALVQTQKPVDIAHFSNLGGIALFCPSHIPFVIRLSSDTPSCRRAGGYDNRNRLAMFQAEAIENLAIRRARAVYGPSIKVSAIVEDRLGRTVTTIRPPVFLETGERDEYLFHEKIGEGPFLLFFGRLNRLKGLVVLADILEAVLGHHPMLRIVIIGREHAGHAGTTMAEHLRHKAGPFSDRLIILDPVCHAKLYPIIERATAVILPSLIDNFPNSMLESMLFGRVIIACRGTGVDELIEDGVNGMLCTSNDPEALLKRTEECLALPLETRQSMGQAAKKSVEELRPEKTIPELLDFLARISHQVS